MFAAAAAVSGRRGFACREPGPDSTRLVTTGIGALERGDQNEAVFKL